MKRYFTVRDKDDVIVAQVYAESTVEAIQKACAIYAARRDWHATPCLEWVKE